MLTCTVAVVMLRVAGDRVEVIVWNSDPVLPVARAAEAGRVGQHGLEIVMAVSQGFEVQQELVGKRINSGGLQDQG
ncbi:MULTISPECIES: ATP-binding protein [Streptomyces]|uniref:ATP-binding protein n=1 Tax=Streptomyces galilaeus TaxID=33899 RepID=A0ABW9IY82_STRGJ